MFCSISLRRDSCLAVSVDFTFFFFFFFFNEWNYSNLFIFCEEYYIGYFSFYYCNFHMWNVNETVIRLKSMYEILVFPSFSVGSMIAYRVFFLLLFWFLYVKCYWNGYSIKKYVWNYSFCVRNIIQGIFPSISLIFLIEMLLEWIFDWKVGTDIRLKNMYETSLPPVQGDTTRCHRSHRHTQTDRWKWNLHLSVFAGGKNISRPFKPKLYGYATPCFTLIW